MAVWHRLQISDQPGGRFSLTLDGVEVRGVTGYRWERRGVRPGELTVSLYVQGVGQTQSYEVDAHGTVIEGGEVPESLSPRDDA